jgi:truncated hemoglobin YjbI
LQEARAVHGKLEHEARLLDAVTAGIAARRGELITPANPRRRALEALRAEHPQRYLELLRQAEEEARRTAAEKRAASKRARREQRDLERGRRNA